MHARPLRDTTPGKIHLLSCRTLHSELLFVPKAELNQILGSVVAKYQADYNIEIYALIFLSNHYHMLASAPQGALPRFFESVNREIAHRVNRYTGRNGYLWARRYDDLLVLEDQDVLEALLYVVTNNVKHALGSHPRHWPGVNSYAQTVGASDKEYSFFNYTAYHAAKRKAERRGEWVRRSDFESMHTLKITPISRLPRLVNLAPERLKQLIEQRVQKLITEHKIANRIIMNRKAILNQPIKGSFPSNTNTTPRPICYTKNPHARAQYAKERKLLYIQYKKASIRFRLEEYHVKFPPYTLKPPAHQHPKVLIPQRTL